MTPMVMSERFKDLLLRGETKAVGLSALVRGQGKLRFDAMKIKFTDDGNLDVTFCWAGHETLTMRVSGPQPYQHLTIDGIEGEMRVDLSGV